MNDELGALDSELSSAINALREDLDVPSPGAIARVQQRLGDGFSPNSGGGPTNTIPTNLGIKLGTLLFISGVATGYGIKSLSAEAPKTIIVESETLTVPKKPAVQAETPQSPEPAAQPEAPKKKRHTKRSSNIDAERSLLQQARNALTRARYDAALKVLALHKKQFPKGQLSEERDALQVGALAKSGQSERASSAAQTFLENYPSSLFKSTILPYLE